VPNLLAIFLDAKFANHLPLNRQSEAYTREGIDLDVSTLADWVGACTATLAPQFTLIKAHVMSAERLHGDDMTVRVLAKGKTIIGRPWTYVRDDRPFGGPASSAANFYYSPSSCAMTAISRTVSRLALGMSAATNSTPTAMMTATDTMRPFWRTLTYVASSHT
jgi:hypothetical protein